jgi:hypothetical protein
MHVCYNYAVADQTDRCAQHTTSEAEQPSAKYEKLVSCTAGGSAVAEPLLWHCCALAAVCNYLSRLSFDYFVLPSCFTTAASLQVQSNLFGEVPSMLN